MIPGTRFYDFANYFPVLLLNFSVYALPCFSLFAAGWPGEAFSVVSDAKVC